ncbi:MAG: DUF5658 family protein [Candidatus Cloacimonadota bacterium]|nr:DUF5658 family protein [Candidatus Cloacimonadota bacterium]
MIYFIILNVLDAHSTFLVVSISDCRSERNPIARYFFKKFGIIRGIIVLKGVILFIIPLMVWVFVTDSYKINLTLTIANFLYSLVVLNNYRIYKKIKKIRQE